MTRTNQLPDQARDIADLKRRVYNLERRINDNVSGGGTGGDTIRIGWFVDGPLTTGTSRGFPLGTNDSYTLTELDATLDTAGSSSTVLSIRRNGTEFATMTLASTVTSMSLTLAIAYVVGDIYTIAITTVGTGAEGLQTFARFAS